MSYFQTNIAMKREKDEEREVTTDQYCYIVSKEKMTL